MTGPLALVTEVLEVGVVITGTGRLENLSQVAQ